MIALPGSPPADDRNLHGQTGWRQRVSFRSIAVGLALLVAVGLLAWYLTPGAGSRAGRGGRFNQNTPMPVVGTPAKSGDMPVTLNALGTVTPLATVTVKTQISGYLAQVAFQEGQTVKQGDFLAQIDPRPYQVALEQAEGTLARDQALLADARLDLTRYEQLVAQDSIAAQQRDTQRALVKQDEGIVKTDQGQVDGAKLNLVYCHIVAPISGRVGLRQVDQGNYVTPGDANGIVVITQLQPITVLFTLPEDSIPATLKRFRAGATLTVDAWDRAHVTKLADGALASIDNQIDVTTGTVKLKANFPNIDESLFPNQFVNAELLLDTQHGATLVPQSAIQRGAPGTFVYLIDTATQTVAVRPVTLGPGRREQRRHRQGAECRRPRRDGRRRQAEGRRQDHAAVGQGKGQRARFGRSTRDRSTGDRSTGNGRSRACRRTERGGRRHRRPARQSRRPQPRRQSGGGRPAGQSPPASPERRPAER